MDVQQAMREKALNGICPLCDSGPFVSVAGHANRKHGVDRFQLKDMLGMFYSEPLCSPELSERFSERSKRLYDLGLLGIHDMELGTKKHLSQAAVKQQKVKSAQLTPENRRQIGHLLSERAAIQNADRDEAIARMMKNGVMDRDIAKETGLTTHALREIRERRRIGGVSARDRYAAAKKGIDSPALIAGRETVKRMALEETAEMVEKYEAGVTIVELAVERGVLEQAVKTRLRNAGVAVPDGRSDPHRRKPPPRAPLPPKYCELDGCGNRYQAKGLCGKHYQRMMKAKRLT